MYYEESMDNIVENLQSINKALERHNEIFQKISDTMKKPEHKLTQVLKIIGLNAGALAIFNVIENIIKWFIGG
jgi:exonuclease VII small subunit